MLVNRNPFVTKMNIPKPLPLHGIRVVEFTHMVMGPTCGMVLADLGVHGLTLCDTTGMAYPTQAATLTRAARLRWPGTELTLHFHNTRGMGLANVLAAVQGGIERFDGSLGGLGGCPYAPGASGNVVTEDLVFMFEAMGIATGINLARLIAARAPLQAGLPGEPLYGMTPEAGLPKGWLLV